MTEALSPVRRTAAGLDWEVVDTGPPAADTPVLVLLPGTLGTATVFAAQIAALRDRARMIALTYPVLDALDPIVDSLLALLGELGVGRFSVLGSSLGGFVAQLVAARVPDRIDTLFIGNSLVDPSILRLGLPPVAELKTMPAQAHRDIVVGSVARWPEPEPVFAHLKTMLAESAERITAEGLKARVVALRQHDPVPPLALPDTRIVIIECADDPLVTADVQEAVKAAYPGAEVHRLPVGGHYPYVTRPEAYTAIIRARLL